MNLLIVYECNNGYTCGCCGHDWEETGVLEIEGEDHEAAIDEERTYLEESFKKNDYGRRKILAAYVIAKELIKKED